MGFENITDMDKSRPETKEEDIQIIEGERPRNNFNVDAIYLVNHQRHLPPQDRKVVLFSDNQIKDAE
ncbi:MAG: hypothetical protein LBL19_03890 [Spirochaetaceae bacterium]|jgi:hypothetical protein|nr:hypothetical protein [Spirochaetaceae bacterium]